MPVVDRSIGNSEYVRYASDGEHSVTLECRVQLPSGGLGEQPSQAAGVEGPNRFDVGVMTGIRSKRLNVRDREESGALCAEAHMRNVLDHPGEPLPVGVQRYEGASALHEKRIHLCPVPLTVQ